MAQKPEITVNGLNRTERTLRKIENFSEYPDRALLYEIGLFMQTRIKVRTSEGKDVDGKAFEPYSPAYALFRSKEQHPVSKVNLLFSGSMMSSMTFEIGQEQRSVLLFFLNTADETGARNPAKAFFLNEKRTFFSLSEQDVNDIVEMSRKFYRRKVRRK